MSKMIYMLMLEARGNKEKEVTLRQGQQKEVFKVILEHFYIVFTTI